MPAAAPLLLVGALAAARAAAAPPADTSWYGRASHPSPAWRSVAAFGAVGDGVHDDTRAIQAALDAARGDSGAKAPAVVYVPPGDYLISDTLRVWGFTTLRGCSTSPPTLRLAPAAPGFGNVSALRPLLASTSGWGVNLTAGLPPWWHNTLPSNFLFYQQVHALSLDVSAAGNDGAVALYWCVAQQTSVRDVRITVGGAFSGIDMCQLPGYAPAPGGGSGGGGSIEDVSVSGGAYGIRGMASQYAFRGLRLAGARVAAVALLDFVWTFAFVDVAIADTPAALVTRGLGDRHSTLVALVDAVLANITGPAALVLGGAGTPTFLQNVTLRGSAACTAVVANATSAGALDAVWLAADGAGGGGGGGGGGATLVERWVGWLDDGAPGVGNFVGGARFPESRTALPGAPRAPLASLARPWLDDLAAPPCNAVTDCGARGDGASDDTAALQRCLDACEAVYLPFGVFLVTDTLNLSARTALTGEMLSNIRLAPHAPGFGAAGAPRALLDTPDDAAARVRITDVSLGAGAGNAGAVLLRWRAGGAGSGLWDVNVNISTPVARGVHAAGHGAGVFSNVHIWGADHSWETNAPIHDARAGVGFLGESAGPLTTYALISEHHVDAMVHVTGAARNYALVITQTEEYQYPTNSSNSSNTVHVLVDGGAADVTLYGVLTCNWWKPAVAQLVAAWGVGANVSIIGAKGVGSDAGLVHQPSTPGLDTHGTRADNPFYGVPADIDIPSA
jgi:hypothetical protein